MCTAITLNNRDFYFGRNLDLEYHYQEEVTVTPRNYSFHFRNGTTLNSHYALIGMATISDNYPLYYDATNEKGLSMAGLNFPQNAVYNPPVEGRDNVAPFELIPWILGQAETVDKAINLLKAINLWELPFNDQFSTSPLHWLLADKDRSVTIEPMADGLKIHDNPYGVLTNNPPFEYHRLNLSNYMNLTPQPPQNRFNKKIEILPFSLGMGAIGLPGDPSSPSRFIRAVFTKFNSVIPSEDQALSQFFHILKSVEQPRGVTCVRNNEYEFTLYSSCCNTTKGIYYYTTYENSCITAVDMHKTDLNSQNLSRYPLITQPKINYQN
jgi:choloylglycine hydrolase